MTKTNKRRENRKSDKNSMTVGRIDLCKQNRRIILKFRSSFLIPNAWPIYSVGLFWFGVLWLFEMDANACSLLFDSEMISIWILNSVWFFHAIITNFFILSFWQILSLVHHSNENDCYILLQHIYVFCSYHNSFCRCVQNLAEFSSYNHFHNKYQFLWGVCEG